MTDRSSSASLSSEASSLPSAVPLWSPKSGELARTHLGRLMRQLGVDTYPAAHAWSVGNPAAFWKLTAEELGIRFAQPFERVLDLSHGPERPRWFVGGKLNIAESCLSGPANDTAIITRRSDGRTEAVSVGELASLSRRAAAGFAAAGIRQGDGVAMMTMMSVEAVAAYLGVLLLGGYVVSVPETLPADEIRTRLRIGHARLVVTQDVLVRGGKTYPLYDRVKAAGAPRAVVFTAAARSKIPLEIGDVTWSDFLPVDDQFDPAACDPDTCINVLFSSGTTGDPKAIPWEHVTPIKAAGDGHWHHDLRPGDVLCWPTSLGWMMGPWLVFAGLLNRATIALYEGGPVEPGFCEFVRDAQVTVLGVVPSIVRGWRRAGCAEGVDWSAIRLFSSSGEASDPDDYTYLMRLGGPEGESRPVIEYCGGSELAGGYVASTLLAPNCPSVFNAKMMGTDFVVLGPGGHPCRPGEVGEVFLIPPAIGMTTRLLNQDNEEVYYAGCPERNGMRLRRHGDLMLVLGEDRYRSLGRADDTMNLGGIKTSSAEIEQAVARTPGVVEAAAVGVPPPKGGPDRLVLFVVAPGQAPADLAVALQRAIRDRANPLFHLHDIVAVDALPRTASNKVLRRELRKRYQEEEAAEPPAT